MYSKLIVFNCCYCFGERVCAAEGLEPVSQFGGSQRLPNANVRRAGGKQCWWWMVVYQCQPVSSGTNLRTVVVAYARVLHWPASVVV